jgi:hypothetical protein
MRKVDFRLRAHAQRAESDGSRDQKSIFEMGQIIRPKASPPACYPERRVGKEIWGATFQKIQANAQY